MLEELDAATTDANGVCSRAGMGGRSSRPFRLPDRMPADAWRKRANDAESSVELARMNDDRPPPRGRFSVSLTIEQLCATPRDTGTLSR
jgi:hypothetical protein